MTRKLKWAKTSLILGYECLTFSNYRIARINLGGIIRWSLYYAGMPIAQLKKFQTCKRIADLIVFGD